MSLCFTIRIKQIVKCPKNVHRGKYFVLPALFIPFFFFRKLQIELVVKITLKSALILKFLLKI